MPLLNKRRVHGDIPGLRYCPDQKNTLGCVAAKLGDRNENKGAAWLTVLVCFVTALVAARSVPPTFLKIKTYVPVDNGFSSQNS
ncbi:MAG: hypothetical protein DMG05_00260 [Acidobacteria bacterium]|nr:MAG: hypothetical protein DMG05_00260 [Acidobacteriota bacterium]